MATLDPESVDAIVTDPPYGLSFMGKDWDHGVPGEHFWREALRVAKPGAHLLAFGGTRTFHRLACAIEDAGWEIRDCLGWLYGQGFPKSHDVSKAIDKAAGATREVIGTRPGSYGAGSMLSRATQSAYGYRPPGKPYPGELVGTVPITAPATPDAERWQGWGTALKPAWEPVILARKPLAGTVAANVLAHGTGALNIDGCRIGTETVRINTFDDGAKFFRNRAGHPYTGRASTGRWPANVLHDGSDEVLAVFPQVTSGKPCGIRGRNSYGFTSDEGTELTGYGDSGSASRFFKCCPQDESDELFLCNAKAVGEAASASRLIYCAKASKTDRDEGCETLGERAGKRTLSGGADTRGRPTPVNCNTHPTVKPTALMRYLCRLITPPGGIILDPFCGSGSTGKAAVLEGFDFIGIDLSPEYIAIADARIAAVSRQEALALA